MFWLIALAIVLACTAASFVFLTFRLADSGFIKAHFTLWKGRLVSAGLWLIGQLIPILKVG